MAHSARLVELIDWYKRSHPSTSDAEIARRAGMTPANLSQWRSNGLRGLPARARLDALASTIGRPYREVLDAALADTGYADVRAGVVEDARTYDEILNDAVRVLTEAARLTNQPGRQKADGSWEPDPHADPLAIDWGAFVTDALAGAAANIGGIDAILAGRPGSWEAAVVGDALRAAVGHDEWDLWRHRTEPVTVVLHPERLLFDNNDSDWFDEVDRAEAEIQRRETAVTGPGVIYTYGRELDPRTLQRALDEGIEIRQGQPQPLPTAEEIEAWQAAERENPTPATPEEEAEDAALAALQDLRNAVEAQARAELIAYGERLAAAVRTELAALELPVPVSVTVDVDTPWDMAPESPLLDWTTSRIDGAVASAIAATPLPDELPGTVLERAEAAHQQQIEGNR
ncbi:XRE family transcriptional regulator [Mycolicibacterium fortuitum]|uniref:XRE family transcriptional regulator n=3 Tax=Mycolicibacterium fortuitum TaxID=1766 RepID=UPI001C115D75|nr:XRE family transcriptional regulator [Mycolicibacterium fortuitum]MDV7195253.1 XRE family transcriptional regulator [Mycolicibacterium fortuitum]